MKEAQNGSGSTIPSVEKFLPPLDGATFDEIIVRLTTNFGEIV
jgi:hypothetical protein